MREIKFRAWDKVAKTWVNFYDNPGFLITPLGGIVDGGTWGTGDFFLCQFTGLKDKNGKEIYEGDILKKHWFNVNNEWIGGEWVVRFGECNTTEIEHGDQWIGFYCDRINACRPYDVNGEHETILHCKDALEVIGNIYEDLELLK